MTCGIYIFTAPDDNQYVGRSVNCEQRVLAHYYNAQKLKNDTPLYKAIRHFGFKNFNIDFIPVNIKFLRGYERFYVNICDSFNNGYNQTRGGEGTHYDNMTKEQIAESKLKMSILNKGKKMDPELVQKNPCNNPGMKFSPERDAKISKSNTGKVRTLEHIANYQKAALNRSPEHLVKIAATKAANKLIRDALKNNHNSNLHLQCLLEVE
jgi:group I intron endonuclease